jgi:hypothetical protein
MCKLNSTGEITKLALIINKKAHQITQTKEQKQRGA